MNVIMETEAFSGCLISIKKLVSLNIFLPEVEILFEHLSKKIVHFMTPQSIKEEIIRFCKDIIKNEVVFEYFTALDLHPERQDTIAHLIESLAKVYTGIKPP